MIVKPRPLGTSYRHFAYSLFSKFSWIVIRLPVHIKELIDHIFHEGPLRSEQQDPVQRFLKEWSLVTFLVEKGESQLENPCLMTSLGRFSHDFLEPQKSS